MNRRFLSARNALAAVAAILALGSAAACHSNSSSGSPGVAASSSVGADASSAEAQAKAIASATANVNAENAVKSDINTCLNKVQPLALATTKGRQTVVTCIEALVPQDKRSAFGNALLLLLVKDKVWTKGGRQQLEDTDVAHLVNQYAGPNATATPTSTATTTVTPKPVATTAKP